MMVAVDILGGMLTLLLIVNVFRILAGVRFSHWRHVISAYAAGLWAASFTAAFNGVDPLAYLPGLPFAVALEIAVLRKRVVMDNQRG